MIPTIKDKVIENMFNLTDISFAIANLKEAQKKYLAEKTTEADQKATEILNIINSLSALRAKVDTETDELIDRIYHLEECFNLEI